MAGGEVQCPPPEAEWTSESLSEAELNTIGYVISHYGTLTGKDLEHLSHSETPWQTADRLRQPGGSVTIKLEWIREYFRTDGNPSAGEDDIPLDSGAISEWLKGLNEVSAPADESDETYALVSMRDAILARRAGA